MGEVKNAARRSAREKPPSLTIRFHQNPHTDEANRAGAEQEIPAAVNGFDG
jgi:hypothetical protein